MVVACVLAGVWGVGVVSCSGGQGVSDQESVDPWAVAASLDAARATASASVQASRDAVLGPELVAQREAALAMEEPVWPVEAEQNDPTGAQQAAIYFVSLYPYAFATGDLTQWDAMSENRCVLCTSIHDGVTQLHEDGGWADPWSLEPSGTEYWDPTPGYDHSRVDVTYSAGPATSHLGDGSHQTTSDAEEGAVITLAMRYVNGRWMVGAGEAR